MVVSDALNALFPGEMSLETYNAQYLQRHPTDAGAVLGAARGLEILGSPRDEIEGVLFGTLNPEVDLPLKVRCCRWFQLACQLNAIVHRLRSTYGHS